MGNKVTLIVVFSAILVLFFGMTLFDDAQAIKSKGNSLTETTSKQVCGNFICDEPMSIAEKIAIYLLTLVQQEETETEILQQGVTVATRPSIAHKGSGGMSTVFPDLTKTPSPAGPVPIPYPNIAKASDTDKGTEKVKVGQNDLMVKASKLASKLINKYDLNQERLTAGVKKSIEVEKFKVLTLDTKISKKSTPMMEQMLMNKAGTQTQDTPPTSGANDSITGTNQQAIQQFDEQIASLAAQTGLSENILEALANKLLIQDPNEDKSQLCRILEIYILEKEINELKIKLDSLQIDRDEFKDDLRHYDSSNPGHQPLIIQLLNLIENTNKQMQSIEDKISQKESKINYLENYVCGESDDLYDDKDVLQDAVAELKRLAIEKAERDRQEAAGN